jgi:predicted DNA-binding protein (MmcQ/YjbR family)
MMDIEKLRDFCHTLPAVTEDVKWGNDLCFCVGGKMFCVVPLNAPFSVSFKVTDEEFDELANSRQVIPAPYAARYKWVLVTGGGRFSDKQWQHYIAQSYALVRDKLPKKLRPAGAGKK